MIAEFPLIELRDGCSLCGEEIHAGEKIVLSVRSESGKRIATHARHFEEDAARRKAMGLQPEVKRTRYFKANVRIAG